MSDQTKMDMPLPAPTLDELVAEIDLEISMRERVFPAWVAQGRMKASTAEVRLHRLRTVRVLLDGLRRIMARPGDKTGLVGADGLFDFTKLDVPPYSGGRA
jgi:hypothetical protein